MNTGSNSDPSTKFKESTMLFSYIDALFLYSPMSDCYVESAGAYNEYIQKTHIQA